MVGGVEKLAFLWGAPECISLRPFLVAIAIFQVYSETLVLHACPVCETKKVKKVRGGGPTAAKTEPSEWALKHKRMARIITLRSSCLINSLHAHGLICK